MSEYRPIHNESIQYRESHVSNHRLDTLMTVLHCSSRFVDVSVDVDVRDLLSETKKGHFEIPAIAYEVRLEFSDYRQYQAFIVKFIEELDKRSDATQAEEQDEE